MPSASLEALCQGAFVRRRRFRPCAVGVFHLQVRRAFDLREMRRGPGGPRDEETLRVVLGAKGVDLARGEHLKRIESRFGFGSSLRAKGFLNGFDVVVDEKKNCSPQLSPQAGMAFRKRSTIATMFNMFHVQTYSKLFTPR